MVQFESVESWEVLDLASLRELADGDEDFMSNLFDAFLASAGRLIGDLERAIDNGDEPGIRRALHTLKGASASAGACQIAEACKQVEESQDWSPEQWPFVVATFRMLLSRVDAMVEGHFGKAA
jgi:HPt (histidine-containing phosphotransfer) domain-containing protein